MMCLLESITPVHLLYAAACVCAGQLVWSNFWLSCCFKGWCCAWVYFVVWARLAYFTVQYGVRSTMSRSTSLQTGIYTYMEIHLFWVQTTMEQSVACDSWYVSAVLFLLMSNPALTLFLTRSLPRPVSSVSKVEFFVCFQLLIQFCQQACLISILAYPC